MSAVRLSTGRKYAIKVMNKRRFALVQTKRREALMDEVRILQEVDHPNIIKIHEVFDTDTHLYIVLDLCACRTARVAPPCASLCGSRACTRVTGGDLFDFVVDRGNLPEPMARGIFIQMLRAVQYLHERGVSHRCVRAFVRSCAAALGRRRGSRVRGAATAT